MKILLTSNSGIYAPEYSDTKREQTGFAIMIRALAKMLPMHGDEVDIITQSNFTKGHKIGGSNLLKKTWLDIFLHTKPCYLKKAFDFCRKEKMPFKMKLRVLLYFLTASYCEHLIKKNKYDVVHINGIGIASTAYMYACIRTSTPFVLTLHGLNSFRKDISHESFGIKQERQFFIQNKDNPKAISTVISTGIKNRLCGVVGSDVDTIKVVCNPIISAEKSDIDIPKNEGEKLIVCVGNVSKNKNQQLVVDAFAELRKKNNNVRLVIIGGHEAELRNYAEQQNIANITFTGTIERDKVYAYYDRADLCVMASLEEGFGLSLAEAYSFGVPCVMPRSIDAFPDLYDEECCVPSDDYEIATFADAMNTALSREWDKKKIKAFSEKFSEENCAAGYLSALRMAAEYKSAPFDMSDLNKLVKESLSNKK